MINLFFYFLLIDKKISLISKDYSLLLFSLKLIIGLRHVTQLLMTETVIEGDYDVWDRAGPHKSKLAWDLTIEAFRLLFLFGVGSPLQTQTLPSAGFAYIDLNYITHN